jgi:CRISPR/Cas system-associated exonuclease Cas4 (RecB family)
MQVNMIPKYNAQRKRNLFSFLSAKPYKISRSKIEDFIKCPRCFYLDRKCGTKQPPTFPYTLNNAIDTLLKKEFDQYRITGERHPLMVKHEIDAVPFSHPNLEEWRANLKGIKFHHVLTYLIISGAMDDIWVKPNGELIVVDYKATSTSKEITLENRDSYKRQLEIYQWLLRQNGFKVSNIGYFLICNGDSSEAGFTGKLSFDFLLLPHEGNDSWIENTLLEIKECLSSNIMPASAESCDYCRYFEATRKHVDVHDRKTSKSIFFKFWNYLINQICL